MIPTHHPSPAVAMLGAIASLVSVGMPLPGWAQSITPANDGTQTIVTPAGDRYDITGGQVSPDGLNQFHSFEQFRLSEAEVANFITTQPNLQHILGRISGGDASVIRGLIQVTGVARPDLYLMNPAGFIFTDSARLDIPGSLITTTAAGLQFGEAWWSAIGSVDYNALVGVPTGFWVSGGTILNEGNLAVRSGESLQLIGGTVINTGTLTAPGGTITIAAVPNESLVRLSQSGQLLNLEFATLDAIAPGNAPNPVPFEPLALPELLAGSPALQAATQVQLNPDGTIQLARVTSVQPTIQPTIQPEPGMAIASGRLDVSSPEATGGQIQVGGDRVGLLQADINASGLTGGGVVQIGGTPHGGSDLLQSNLTLMDAPSRIAADAIATGDGGQVILWSDQVTAFDGEITARGGEGGGDGGFVEVSGLESLAFTGLVDVSAALGAWGEILLDPDNITIVAGGTSDPAEIDTRDPFRINAAEDFGTPTIQIAADTLQRQQGNISLEATNNITIAPGVSLTFFADAAAAGSTITFRADADNINGGDFSMDPTQSIIAERRNIQIFGQNITVGTIETSGSAGGGNIDLRAVGDIRTGFLQSFAGAPTTTSTAGNITVISQTGAINTTEGSNNLAGEPNIPSDASLQAIVDIFVDNPERANLSAYAENGQGGDIYLQAPLGVTTSHISSFGLTGSGTIAIDSNAGAINTGVIFSVSEEGIGSAGDTDDLDTNFPEAPDVDGDGLTSNPSDILLIAAENITTSHLLSATQGGGRSGDIFVTTGGSFNIQGASIFSRSEGGAAGTIDILATGAVEQLDDIVSDGETAGGDIVIQAEQGGLDLLNAEISSFAETGAAGNVRLTAQENIILNSIDSSGLTSGGAIDIISQTGSITTRGEVTSASIVRDSSDNFTGGGTAGRIAITAASDILAERDIRSEGYLSGGSIEFTSQTGRITTQGELSSLSPTGRAGNVTLVAPGAIAVAQNISSEGFQQGGNIGLRSTAGSVTTQGFLNSFSSRQNAGDVTIQALEQITVAREVSSEGFQRGGAISLTSQTGGITVNGELDSFALNGVASAVTLSAVGNINIQDIDSSGPSQGGAITLESSQGAIAIAGEVSSESLRENVVGTIIGGDNAGDIAIRALGDITTLADLSSEGFTVGGRIGMTSRLGSIRNQGELRSQSLFLGSNGDFTGGRAGSVQLQAGIDVVTQDIASQGFTAGGTVQITSGLRPGSGGNLIVQGVDSFAPNGVAGDIEIISNGGISTQGDLISEGLTRGGNITVQTARDMDTRLIEVRSLSAAGRAGNVTYTANSSIGFGRIDSNGLAQGGAITMTSHQDLIYGFIPINDPSGQSLISRSPQGRAGDVTLTAARGIVMDSGIASDGQQRGGNLTLTTTQGNLAIGGLLTSQSSSGTAGSITLTAPAGAIAAASNLDSFSTTGVGGNVTVQAFGDLALQNIATFGALGSGDVTLNSINGSITTLDISTTAPNGTSGNVTLNAQGNITTGNITSSGRFSGNINLSSIEGDVTTGELFSSTGDISVQGEGIFGEGGIGEGAGAIVNPNASETVADLEADRAQEFSDYFGQDLTSFAQSPAEIDAALRNIEALTGNRTAIIYVKAPVTVIERLDQRPSPLELVIFVAGQPPISITVPGVTRTQLFDEVQGFRQNLFTSLRRRARTYLPAAQRLYNWLIAPVERQLGEAAVDTLLFSMDSGLRSLPIAALHDGNGFLIEKYGLGMVPSIGLMDTTYTSLADAQVLAMGASQFETLNPLPAVPVELSVINDLWGSDTELNEDFTRANLLRLRQTSPFQILHLATHASFNPGTAADSYIQLWGSDRLQLNELSSLSLDNPPVDLLVLSACQTALGNPEAELGFAGIAVASGVRSTLASLWSVSDEGTLALMSEFYDQLQEAVVKSEALRNAQLAMLRGETRIESGQILRSPSSTRGAIVLPPELNDVQTRDLSHPFYWAGFTMIGSPW